MTLTGNGQWMIRSVQISKVHFGTDTFDQSNAGAPVGGQRA